MSPKNYATWAALVIAALAVLTSILMAAVPFARDIYTQHILVQGHRPLPR